MQRVQEIYLDCDQDTVLLKVEQVGGAACHTGYQSCFYRRRRGEGWEVVGSPIFDPRRFMGPDKWQTAAGETPALRKVYPKEVYGGG